MKRVKLILFFTIIFFENKSNLYNFCNGLGVVTKIIYPSENIDQNNNLVISNSIYSNFLGKFDAGVNGSLFLSKLNLGTLEEKDISTAFLTKLKSSLFGRFIVYLTISNIV